MGFLDKLRTPKLFGYGGSETAGESSAADRYLSQMELERNLNPGGGDRGYGSGFGRERQAPMMRMMQAPKPMRDVRDKMDVVYDQRPEMFKKQMDLQNASLEQKGKLGFEELANQRRGQDIDSRELDLKKWALENPGLELREVEGGNFATFDKRTGKLVDTGISTGTVGEREKLRLMDEYQRGQIGLRNQGGLAEAELRNKGGLAEAELRNQGNLAVANVREAPPPMPATQLDDLMTHKARELVARNPNLASVIKLDPETGRFIGLAEPIGPSRTDAVGNLGARRQAADILYGAGGSSMPGLGSSSLGGGGQTKPAEAPGGSTQAPHVTSGTKPKPIVQVSPSTGKKRQSDDGGKTWRPL